MMPTYASRAARNSGGVAAFKAWQQDTDEEWRVVALAKAWPLHIAPTCADAEPTIEAWLERLRRVPIVCRGAT